MLRCAIGMARNFSRGELAAKPGHQILSPHLMPHLIVACMYD